MDIDLKHPQLMHMVNFTGGDFVMQPIRFKKDQLNEMTLAYLRSVLKSSFFKAESITALAGRKVLLTLPRNLAYEKHVFKFY